MSRLESVLARRLRVLAKEQGLPLSHLADRAGIARSFLWRVLGDEASPTLHTVQRLAEVLGVSPLDLLSELLRVDAAFVTQRRPPHRRAA